MYRISKKPGKSTITELSKCPRQDSNLYMETHTTTWTLRVCQFRHLGIDIYNTIKYTESWQNYKYFSPTNCDQFKSLLYFN